MLRRDLPRASAVAGATTVAGRLSRSGDPASGGGFEDGIGAWGSGAAIGPEVEVERETVDRLLGYGESFWPQGFWRVSDDHPAERVIERFDI